MADKSFAFDMFFRGKDLISGSIKSGVKSMEQFGAEGKKSFKKASDGADTLKDRMANLRSVMGGVFLGNLLTKGFDLAVNGVKALVSSIPEYTDRLDAIGKSADKIGLSAEAFQKIGYAAELANVSTEQLSGAFNFLNKNLGNNSLKKFLSETNRGLLQSVNAAASNEEVFYLLSDAISKETDIARRAALGNAAFGKSWAELYPLMMDGAEAMRETGEGIPDLASNGAIARAQMWNDTWTIISRTVNGFKDILKETVIENVLPYVRVIQQWISENRELVKAKIKEFLERAVVWIKRAVKGVTEFIGKVERIISVFKEWWPAIKLIGGAALVFFGITKAIDTVKTSFAILNAVMSANPVGAVITGIVLAVMGFKLLVDHVGGLGPALEVAGQTIMKFLLAPLNLVLDAVQGLTFALGHIPGLGWAKTASEAIGGFQDKMNIALTGGAGTFLESGVEGAMAGYESGGVLGAAGGAIGGALGVAGESLSAHRSAYLERSGGAGDSGGLEAVLGSLQEQAALLRSIDSSARSIDDSTGNLAADTGPKALRYSQMGQADVWTIIREGL